MTDQEIAKDIQLKHISKIAEKLGLNVDDIEMYGKYKAKLPATLVYKEDTLQIDDLKNSYFSSVKWWYKYLHYRKIPRKGQNECLW